MSKVQLEFIDKYINSKINANNELMVGIQMKKCSWATFFYLDKRTKSFNISNDLSISFGL